MTNVRRLLDLYSGVMQTRIFDKVGNNDLKGSIRLVVKARGLMSDEELEYCENYYRAGEY
jgi:hypothetical protein